MSHLLLSRCSRYIKNVCEKVRRYSEYQSLQLSEFSVSPYCNVWVNCPFPVFVRPLDFFSFPNGDRVLVKLMTKNGNTQSRLTYRQEDDNVHIDGSGGSGEDELTCVIEAPIKSALNVKTTGTKSFIDVANFGGANVILETDRGDIIAEKCENTKVFLKSTDGNILTKSLIQAAYIDLITKKGSVRTERLQANFLTVQTDSGNIETQSSYCNETTFETNTGNMNLNNAHRHCAIKMNRSGTLNLSGVDGAVHADLVDPKQINIQLSKLEDQSEINVRNSCPVELRVADWVIENALLSINASNVNLSESVEKLVGTKSGKHVVLQSKNTKPLGELVLNAEKAAVNLDIASWSDMLKLRSIDVKPVMI